MVPTKFPLVGLVPELPVVFQNEAELKPPSVAALTLVKPVPLPAKLFDGLLKAIWPDGGPLPVAGK